MSIKIHAEFHGIKDDCDMWINYFPHGCCNMDQRVIDFFENLHSRGMDKYDEQREKYFKEDEEKREKEELRRLQKKYSKL